jgi:hypothetical protein
MNRAAKSLNRWRSEYWECQFYAGNTKHDRKWFKRSYARARRRLSKAVLLEQSP